MPAYTDALDHAGRLDGYTPAIQYTPSKRDEELAAKLEKSFMDSYNSKSTTANKWELYHLYLKGEPLLINNTTGEILRLAPEDARNLKSNNNSLRPTHRSFVGKFTREIPIGECTPATDDFEEQHGALVGTAWLEWFFEKECLETKFTDAIENLSATGSGFLYLDWDFNNGPKKSYCEVCSYVGDKEEIGHDCPNCAMQRHNEEMILQDQQETIEDEAINSVLEQLPPDVAFSADMVPTDLPEPEPEQMGPLPLDMEVPALYEIKAGLPRIESLDPATVFPEPGVSCLEKAGWFITRDTISVSEARNLYPEHAPCDRDWETQ